MDNFSEILKDQAIFNAKLESNLSKLSDVAPVATNPEQVFNVRTRDGKQTTDPPYPKGTTIPPARTPTAPATSAVPVAPAEALERDNDVEEGVGTRNVVHGMKQLGAKNFDNQVKYNTPIKFKGTQDTTNAQQSKAKAKPIKSSKKPKPHASQDNFYADYVLTWNHKGKVVTKYVGPRTKGTLIKRNVWVPNVLVTNTLGPKPTWIPKTQA
jgi:hypothetical protein